MRSEKQREQSRINGAKSRGPKNRERVRFNALTHRLRADQLILPGEDPAAFDALRDGLFAEWDPETLTSSALLVERLAVNTGWLQRRLAPTSPIAASPPRDRLRLRGRQRRRRV